MNMGAIARHWLREGISFDLIYTGYLGSIPAIEEVMWILDHILAPGGRIIVDPAMADHGKFYKGFDDAYGEAMKKLCQRADIVLPNITEAAMMSEMSYRETFDETYVRALLMTFPGKSVLLTGVGFAPDQTGFALRQDGQIHIEHHRRLDRSYHGTGDLFASAFVGALASGKSEPEAARIASNFTLRSIENTYDQPAHQYGVKFETALPELIRSLSE